MDQTTTDQMMMFMNSMRYYRGWIFLGTVLLSLLGFTFIFLLPDHYKATTAILVDPQKVPEHYVSPTVSSDPAQRLNTITDQVLSSSRLQQIIDQLQLFPELRGHLSREEIIDAMRKNVVVQVKQGSSPAELSSFTIEYEGAHPQTVAKVANQLAASFIDWNVRNRKQQAEDTTEFLEAQLASAKQNLEAQEKNVSAFKMQHLGEMPEQQAANLQELSQLQTQLQVNADALNRLEVERTLLMRGLDPAAAGSGSRTMAPVTERGRLEAQRLQLKQQLQEMEGRYTPAHPAVRDATVRLQNLEEQIKKLPPDPVLTEGAPEDSPASVRLQLLDREVKRLNAEQGRITSQINSARSKIDAVPVREQQMAELDRNYSVSKEHYQSLLDKTFSAGMAADLERRQEAEHFTVLDVAQVPERPFKPRRSVLLLAAFLGALALSMGLAWMKDRMDTSLKIERELKTLLPTHVPLLAAIPELADLETRRRALRFALMVALVTLVGCALEAGLLLKIHPIL